MIGVSRYFLQRAGMDDSKHGGQTYPEMVKGENSQAWRDQAWKIIVQHETSSTSLLSVFACVFLALFWYLFYG